MLPVSEPFVQIYTDGSCSPNPGVGGWGALLISPAHGNRVLEISGATPETTNNRMEMTAAIEALKRLKGRSRVELYTDSQYLRNAFEHGWLVNWQRNGWQNKAKDAVANKDLWLELLALSEAHEVSWHWVKGHAASVENNRCDELAGLARVALAATLGEDDVRAQTEAVDAVVVRLMDDAAIEQFD